MVVPIENYAQGQGENEYVCMSLSAALMIATLGTTLAAILASFFLRDLPGQKGAAKLFRASFLLMLGVALLLLIGAQLDRFIVLYDFLWNLVIAAWGVTLTLALVWRNRPDLNANWIFVIALIYLLWDTLGEGGFGEAFLYFGVVHFSGAFFVFRRRPHRNSADRK